MAALGIDHARDEVIPPPLALSALSSHPLFSAAVRNWAETMVALHSRNRVLGWFLSDRALAIVSHLCVCLDADVRADDPRSGLTPGRFKTFCVQHGICSEGKAAAIVAFMRLTKHLEAETHPADRRVTRLRPSARMIDATHSRLRAQFASVGRLCPDLAPAAALLGRPDFDRALYAEFLRRFAGGARLLAAAPQLRLFADRDVGMLCLFALMLAADRWAALPPAGPLPLSIAALARRFRVSRTHILRLVRDAEAAGLLVRSSGKGDQIVFTPDLREALTRFFATMFQLAGLCAGAGLAEAGA